MTPIAPLIEAFFNKTLARQRGVSRHTRDSYALSFQLLFVFAAKKLKVSPSALTLEQLDAGLISAFLEYREDERKNASVTRNVRLAAIKSFFRCGCGIEEPGCADDGLRGRTPHRRSLPSETGLDREQAHVDPSRRRQGR
jgi:site-specific recombinase XerD